MRISHELQGVWFEWDSEKADTNVQKHGVSFHTACEVFFDPFVWRLGTSLQCTYNVNTLSHADQLRASATPKVINSFSSYT